MPRVRKTRCYSFPAAHILASRSLSDAENDRIFGKCANPNGHGHDYGVEVCVEGAIDRASGEVVPNALLDEIFDDRVRTGYSHAFLNDVPAFAEAVPTAENVARAIFAALAAPVEERTGARLAAVRVIETSNNFFEVNA
jgi:6-pyruvoyltetrahydropterin/6-carboxytetrahydropterin synthase